MRRDQHDTIICRGNSLAIAPDIPTIERAVREMLAAARGGGVVVLHVLNLWRLPDGLTFGRQDEVLGDLRRVDRYPPQHRNVPEYRFVWTFIDTSKHPDLAA